MPGALRERERKRRSPLRLHPLTPTLFPIVHSPSLSLPLPPFIHRLTSVGGDRSIFHWDVATGAIVRRWRGHDEGPPGASCVAMGGLAESLVLTGGPDTTARAWDLRSRSDVAVAVLRGAKDSVTGVAVPGAGGPGPPALLTPPGGPLVSRPTGAPAAPAAPSPSASPHEIVTASVDGFLRRYDLRAGQLTADGVGSPIASLALTRADGGAAALVACLDGRLRLLDRGTGAVLASYTGHVAAGGVRTDCVILAPDESTVAVGSEDGSVVGWDLASEAVVARVATGCAPGGPVTSVATHPVDGRTMVTGSTDGVVRVFVRRDENGV